MYLLYMLDLAEANVLSCVVCSKNASTACSNFSYQSLSLRRGESVEMRSYSEINTPLRCEGPTAIYLSIYLFIRLFGWDLEGSSVPAS